MIELSIILKASKIKIEKYIEQLTPLLMNTKTELILVNNEIDTIDIPFDYSILRYNNKFNLKEYCITSCVGQRIMIIEEGLQLTSQIINKIKESIKTIDYFNISINQKIYLNKNRSLFFVREKTLVYYRGTIGFTKNIQLTIEDYRLIIPNQDIHENTLMLIDGKHYQELLLWYKNYIILSDKTIQKKFHLTLEKLKLNINNSDILLIEKPFINSNIDNQYIYFLTIKELYDTDKKRFMEIIEKTFNNETINNNLYYSWFIKKSLISKEVPYYLLNLAENIQTSLIYYLLDYDNNANKYIYDFITNSNLKSLYNINLASYLIITKNYLNYINQESRNPETNKKLMKIFELYVHQYNKYLDNTNTEYMINENEFITMFNKASNLIEHNETKKAINILMKLCNNYPQKNKIMYNYIQKLKLTNNFYPCVISICMIVKDEEKNIGRCLKSLKPLVDSNLAEYIIVDTGSTDKTIEIAQEYTNNIYHYKWTGNFSDARNYSILFARGKYIMTIDADEEFKITEINKLIDEFSKPNYEKYNTYTLRIINYTDKELTKFTGMTQARIFRNNGHFYYFNAVHNQPRSELPAKNLNIEFHHYGYIMTEDIREKKFKRTATLLKQELEKNPYNLYFRCQLSSSYGMYGDIKSAVKQVDIYMRIIRDKNIVNDLIFMYYNNAAALYTNIGRYDDAQYICDIALNYKPDFIDFIYYKAYILFLKEDYNQSLIYINKYFVTLKNYHQLNISSDTRYNFYSLGYKDNAIRLFIISNYRLKNYEKCIDMVYEITNNNILNNCLYEIINSYYHTHKYIELINFYQNKIIPINILEIREVFLYFLLDNLYNSTTDESEKFLSILSSKNIEEQLIKQLTAETKNNNAHDTVDSLNLLYKYDIDGMEFNNVYKILLSIIPIIMSIDDNYATSNIYKIKRAMQVILHRTKDLIEGNHIETKKIISLYNKYIDIIKNLVETKKYNLLEQQEILFVYDIKNVLDMKIEEDYRLYYKNKAISDYKQMEYIINLAYNPKDTTNLITPKITIEQYNNQAENMIKNNTLEKAKKLLLRGLIQYPRNTDIMKNLLKLYIKTKDNKNALEIYTKYKMLNPNENDPDIEELISIFNYNKNDHIKVLQGTMDLTKKTSSITRILNNNKINTKLLNYVKNNQYDESDYAIDLNTFKSQNKMLDCTIDTASKLIQEFDIYHFHYLKSLTLNYSDLIVLNKLDKKVFMNVWGQDVRLSYKAVKYNPYTQINLDKDENKKILLQSIAKYIPCCIVSNSELTEYVKEYFEKVEHINMMLDLNRYIPVYEEIDKNKKFTILHTPITSNDTLNILKVIEKLKQKYDFTFLQIQELSIQNIVNDYPKADLIIDQITLGSYSQYAIEAMALEIPVISWISDYMKDKYPDDIPLISANPDNLEEKLTYIIENKDMLKNLGVKGRDYVKKYHNAATEISKLIKIYNE